MDVRGIASGLMPNASGRIPATPGKALLIASYGTGEAGA